jgi:hypothetical protein
MFTWNKSEEIVADGIKDNLNRHGLDISSLDKRVVINVGADHLQGFIQLPISTDGFTLESEDSRHYFFRKPIPRLTKNLKADLKIVVSAAVKFHQEILKAQSLSEQASIVLNSDLDKKPICGIILYLDRSEKNPAVRVGAVSPFFSKKNKSDSEERVILLGKSDPSDILQWASNAKGYLANEASQFKKVVEVSLKTSGFKITSLPSAHSDQPTLKVESTYLIANLTTPQRPHETGCSVDIRAITAMASSNANDVAEILFRQNQALRSFPASTLKKLQLAERILSQ